MATSIMPDTLVRPDVPIGRGATLPHREVIRRLRFLTALERAVLILRKGLAVRRRSIVQTAAILGRSPQKVHAIESVACAKLRHPSTGGVPFPARAAGFRRPDPRGAGSVQHALGDGTEAVVTEGS